MQRQLIATVSGIALLFGAAAAANAQDKPMTDKAAPVQAQSPTSPGAGAIKREGEMNKDPAMQERKSTTTRARSADTSAYRSYEDSKSTMAGAKIVGGRSAEELIGADLVNASGDEIGEIQDLVVGPESEIKTAIVEVGGFLGIGSKFVAVEIDQLTPAKKKGGYMSNLTKEELKTHAEFKKQDGMWVQTYK